MAVIRRPVAGTQLDTTNIGQVDVASGAGQGAGVVGEALGNLGQTVGTANRNDRNLTRDLELNKVRQANQIQEAQLRLNAGVADQKLRQDLGIALDQQRADEGFAVDSQKTDSDIREGELSLSEQIAERQAQQQMSVLEFKADNEFRSFGSRLSASVDEATRNISPDAVGYAESVSTLFNQQSEEYLKTVPEALRPKYASQLAALRAQTVGAAAKTEVTQRGAWFDHELTKSAEERAGQVYNNPDLYESAIAAETDRIRMSGLSPVEKYAKIEALNQQMSTAIAARLLETDPQKLLDGIGVTTRPAVSSRLPTGSPNVSTSPVASPNPDPSLPAGMRNNNPGNLKFSGSDFQRKNFGGMLGPSQNTDQGDPQIVFATPEDGMRAMSTLVDRKVANGQDNVFALVAGPGGWTPPINDSEQEKRRTREIAANVARNMGVAVDAKLDMRDPVVKAKFMSALIKQEHGEAASRAYSDDMIQAAIDRNPMSSYAPKGAAARDSEIDRRVVGEDAQIQEALDRNQAAPGGVRDDMIESAVRRNDRPAGPTSTNVQVAAAFLGKREDNQADSRALSAFIKQACGTDIDPSQTAWCAAFVNGVLGVQGVQGTGSNMAKSFLKFGTTVNDPQEGDIVVFDRGGTSGHVGIFAGYDNATGKMKILGGNQGPKGQGKVSVALYEKDQAIGFRRPPDVSDPAKAMAALQELPGSPTEPVSVGPLDPRLASIPFSKRMELAGQARQSIVQRQQDAETQRKATETLVKDKADLAILNGGIASEQTILGLGLSDDNTASLIRSYRAAQNDRTNVAAQVNSFLAGGLTGLNPVDGDDRSTVNKVYEALEKRIGANPDPQAMQSFNEAFIRQTRMIPSALAADLKLGQMTTDAATFSQSMNTAARYEAVAPDSFQSMEGGTEIRKDLAEYRSLTTDRGMSSEQAAQRIMERRKPEFKRNEELLRGGASKWLNESFDPATGADTVADMIDRWNTSVGAPKDPRIRAAMSADVRQMAEDAYLETAGDAEAAMARVQAQLDDSKVWGASSVNDAGSSRAMKFPPESYYPRLAGGHDYLRLDAQKTVADYAKDTYGDKGTVGGFELKSMPYTADDIRLGRPPRYELWFTVTGEDGQVHYDSAGSWGMTKEDVDKARSEEQNRLRGTEEQRGYNEFLSNRRAFGTYG